MKFINIKLIYLFLIFSFCTTDTVSEPLDTIENINTTIEVQEDATIEVVNDESSFVFELPYKHTYLKFEDCNEYLGSKNEVYCIQGAFISDSINFNGSITNIEFFEDDLYVVLKNGKIVKYNILDNTSEEVFNISNNVRQRGMENGLLDIAISQFDSQFVISYVNLENKLIFELFEYEKEIRKNRSLGILLEIESKSDSHYGGKVIWSENYNCFIGSIGDLQEASFESRIRSDSLDTTKVSGKIIGLNCDSLNIETDIISESETKPLQNLIATGLRNPWQFFEFKDFLVVFDTGFTQNEELNISKFDNKTKNFGWPVFEATKRSEDLDNIENYSLDISYWVNGQQNSALQYIYENSIKPSFYYNHHACESPQFENCDGNSKIYRAAIIGGGILNNPSSSYNFDIFFADHISQELFSFNLIDRSVKIFPIDNLLYVNVVKVFDDKSNKVMVGTDKGQLHIIQLPKS
jgi:hypothetical protein